MIFAFLIISSLAFIHALEDDLAYSDWKKCQNTIYTRPDIFYVTGEASYDAKPTIGII
jgi:hypothetical protein